MPVQNVPESTSVMKWKLLFPLQQINVCVRERGRKMKRECVVCVREREWVRKCLCVFEREREREGEEKTSGMGP